MASVLSVIQFNPREKLFLGVRSPVEGDGLLGKIISYLKLVRITLEK